MSQKLPTPQRQLTQHTDKHAYDSGAPGIEPQGMVSDPGDGESVVSYEGEIAQMPEPCEADGDEENHEEQKRRSPEHWEEEHTGAARHSDHPQDFVEDS